jgi:bacillithiol system protein YtxJ
MKWIMLTEEAQIETIKKESETQAVVIFKHSTRCGTSDMAKMRIERGTDAPIKFYFLDILRYRPLSNKIAEVFEVHHESPQVLLIRNGECVYEESHNGIILAEIEEQSKAA